VVVDVFVSVPVMLVPVPAAPPVKPEPVGADHEYVVPAGTTPLVPFTGVTVKGLPLHVAEVILVTAGPEFTLSGKVVLLHPVVDDVKVKVVAPIDTPVTVLPTTVATAGLLLPHVPPDAGNNVVVLLPQMTEAPKLTVGKLFTFTCVVVLVQPVNVLVNVKVAAPAATPVTTPLFVTEATPGALLTQVPPDEGDKMTVPFPQMELVPTIVATGVSSTVKGSVVLLHPPVAVKVKVTRPADKVVTIPPLVTVATEGLLLTQVPPVEGDTAEGAPTQTEVLPIIATTGRAVTVRDGVV
jgi:hypothetical protein